MGMFSWDCIGCRHPLLCSNATEDQNKWMSHVVAITKEGSILVGEYDGYGRINGLTIPNAVLSSSTAEPECYHKLCWEDSDTPTTFTEASASSADQGWFFVGGVHNSPPPGEPGFFCSEEK